MRYLLLFVLIFFNFCVYADNTNDTNIKQQQIQKILSDWRARAAIPGAVLSIYLPDHQFPLNFSSGTTVYGSGGELGNNTLFQAGSITKSFTSTIILQLESEGKLNIDDPITKYLPQYPQWQNITIRQLLNHTSGIFNYTEAGAFNQIRTTQPRAEFTPELIVRIASQHSNYFPPGRGWKYSNTNYVLAGMIIQKVTGQPIDQFMNQCLHSNLHLNLPNTYYLSGIYTNNTVARMAHGYSCSGADVTSDNMSWANTAGAIVTTSQDLLTWWRGLFKGNILPEQQMSEMMSLVCESSSISCRVGEPISHLSDGEIGKGYGLGIIQSSYGSERMGTVWWHNGSTRGYKAVVMWFPKSDIFLALTINRDPGYLLKPDLPIIRNVMDVLIPNAEWHLAHPKPTHHFLPQKTKKVISHHHKKVTSSN
jgi:D-alanyl-D-alanine carboxypeptidase